MVRGFLQLALVSWLAAAAAAAGEQEALAPPKSVVPPPGVVPDDYQIGPGDVLQIIVWKEQEATVPSVVVRSDGRVGLPFVKEVDLAGLTPAQAEQAITSGE